MKIYFIFLFGWISTTVFAQNLKPETSQNLARRVCTCIADTPAGGETSETIQNCYTSVLTQEAETIQKETGFDIVNSDDANLGRAIGMAIRTELEKSCKAFTVLMNNTPERQLVAQADKFQVEGNYTEALKLYDQLFAVRLDKTIYNARGICKLELGDEYGALADFEYAVQADSLYADAISNRGLAKTRIGAVDAALRDFNKAIKLDAQNPRYIANRGVLFYNSDEYELAVEDFNRAIALGEATAAEYYYLVRAKQELNAPAREILPLYDRAITMIPNNPTLYFERGRYLREQKQWNEAEADLRKSLEINPKDPATHFQLAELYLQKQDISAAQKANSNALSMEINAVFYEQKSRIHLAKKEWESALEAIKIAESRDPFLSIAEGKALCLEQLGRTLEAFEVYQEGIKQNPANPVLYRLRGEYRVRQNQIEQACGDFKLALTLNDPSAGELIRKYCEKQ